MKTSRMKKAAGANRFKSENESAPIQNKGLSGFLESSPDEKEMQSKAVFVYIDRFVTGNNSF